MTARMFTALRTEGALGPETPAFALGRDKGTSFTFHGHRLSSLYRVPSVPRMSFIFLKILKKIRRAPGEGRFEYLQKDERQDELPRLSVGATGKQT